MHVVIRGRLTRGPELRFTPNGKAVINLGVVEQRRRKNEHTGEWEDASAPMFVDVSQWGPEAEHLAELGYGPDTRGRVVVAGNLEAQTYQAKDGTERTKYVVPFADAIQITPSQGDNAGGNGGRLAPPQNGGQQGDPWALPPQSGQQGGQPGGQSAGYSWNEPPF